MHDVMLTGVLWSAAAGLAFNFIASFTRDGGRVAPVEVFKKFQGDPQAAVAKMVAAKADKTDPIQAVVVSTNNITYFTGAHGAVAGLQTLACVSGYAS